MSRKQKDPSSDVSKSFAYIAGFNSYHEYFLDRDKKNPFPELQFVRLKHTEFTSEYILKHGLDNPLMIESHKPDFLKLPDFSSMSEGLEFIASAAGPGTKVRVIDVAKQQDENMAINDYFSNFIPDVEGASSSQRKVLNLISLEMSLSPIATHVLGPRAIREIDWIDQIWPLERRRIADYPRVQKYCLISMAGAYTDFHIDFGGTSVWYHVIKGLKIFYMIAPTIKNLELYEQWLGSKKQTFKFFGDIVDSGDCSRVCIRPGETMIIPAGWIHAVWTLEDSLVFGGNFLSTFTILRQLQVFCIEYRSHVEDIYKFPYFRQMHIYFLTNMYSAVMDRDPKDDRDLKTLPRKFWHLYSFTSNARYLREFVCLLKVVEMWVSNGTLADEDKQAFESSLSSLNLTYSGFFQFWWEKVKDAATVLDAEKNVSDCSDYVARIKESSVVNVFDEGGLNEEGVDDNRKMDVDEESSDDHRISDIKVSATTNVLPVPVKANNKKDKASQPKKPKKSSLEYVDSDDDEAGIVEDGDEFEPDHEDDDFDLEDDGDGIKIEPTVRSTRRSGANIPLLSLEEDDDEVIEDEDDTDILFTTGPTRKKIKSSGERAPRQHDNSDKLLKSSAPRSKPKVLSSREALKKFLMKR